MTADDTASLIYLGLLVFALAGAYLAASRGAVGRVLAQAAVWVLIFLGVIAAYGLWPAVEDALRPTQAAVAGGQAVEVPRALDGHYYLTLDVNGVPVDFTVDTGATEIVLGRRDAEAVGLDPGALRYLGTAMTANGAVRTARVSLERVELEGIADDDVGAVVTEGPLDSSLLGMTYLNRFSRIEIAHGRLVLTR